MRYAKGENRRMIASAQVVASVLVALLLTAGVTGIVSPAAAAEDQEARQLVEKARMTFDSFQADSQMGPSLRALVRKAKGVLIYPQVLRGAFILGGAGGNGVFLVRTGENDTWNGPAFYTIGEASFGLQAGADASEVILVALTDRGVTSLLSTSAKLGAKASVAVGPIGAGAEAATANLSVDLVSYTRNKGLYAGVSVDGAVVASRDGLNQSYYGRPATPTEILIEREVSNPQAAGLIAAVARVAGGRLASAEGSAASAK
jgi:SH3 domain-containing YSC84-like protein 1